MSINEVSCPGCGALNRVPDYSVRRIPECGRCHARLPEPFATRFLRNVYSARLAWPAVPVLALLGWVLWEPTKPSVPDVPRRPIRENASPIGRPTCATNVVPDEGVYRDYSAIRHDGRLTIKTAVGSYYLVSLSDAASGIPTMMFFVNGGSIIDEQVPIGTFSMKYAAGLVWCGEAELFGPDTLFSEADDPLDFASGDHWTVELILRRDGNLREHRITRARFYGSP